MQSFNWNDLKYCLALSRSGTLSAAGRALRTSDTTVARRIRALEEQLGATLFIADAKGQYIATVTGRALLERAEAMEGQSIALTEAAGRAAPALSDVVRISAVPILINRVLVPALPRLHQEHPGLIVELVPEGRNLDLSKREADLALRFSRPVTGGHKIKAQKVSSVGFDVFEPARPAGETSWPWITYDDTSASLPQARWMADVIARTKASSAPLRVSDAETAREAVAQGLGQTVLPTRAGQGDGRMRRVETAEGSPLPSRDVWLLSHVDQNNRRAIEAVKIWLKGIEW